jgi:exodeoxyribonuclease VII large subunit
LQRGYVLVTDRDGHVVKDRATAAARVALTLKFADGPLDVTTGEGPVPTVSAVPPRPAARPRGATDSVQPKLL